MVQSHNNLPITPRLFLREFSDGDAAFVLEILNSPLWLRYIGDRNVKSAEDAARYIQDNLMASYRNQGFGFWRVGLKGTDTAIGLCGFAKRDYLDRVDFGFALLPGYLRAGYGFEIARATLHYGIHSLKLNNIIAITNPDNVASIRLLIKLGFQHERTITQKDRTIVNLLALPQI